MLGSNQCFHDLKARWVMRASGGRPQQVPPHDHQCSTCARSPVLFGGIFELIAKVGFSLTAVAHGRVQDRSQPDDGGQSICVRKVRCLGLNGLFVRVFGFSEHENECPSDFVDLVHVTQVGSGRV